MGKGQGPSQHHEWGTLRKTENTSYWNWRIWGIVNLHKHSNWNSGGWMWVYMPSTCALYNNTKAPTSDLRAFSGLKVHKLLKSLFISVCYLGLLFICTSVLRPWNASAHSFWMIWSWFQYLFLLSRSLPSPASSLHAGRNSIGVMLQYPRMMTGDRL